MKKYFKKMARRVVTLYANRTYRQAVRVAESWYAHTGKRHYVIENPFNERELVAIDTDTFLNIRHKLGIRSKDCTISYLMKTCYYFTESKADGRKMSPKDLVVRRLAFVRDVMKRAKLLD